MHRALILGLSLLLLGCASPQIQARYDALQNPRYPGDANKDLVPYRARDRDGMDCERSEPVQAQVVAVSDQRGRSLREKLDDPAVWDVFFACMAARGWQ